MAQTPGIIDGSIIILKSDGNTIGHSTSFEMSDSISTRNITTKDTATGTEYAGQRSDTTISIEGMVAFDHAENGTELRADAMLLTAVSFTWGSHIVGDALWTASGIITSFSMSAGLDENTTYSMEAVITGAVTVGVSA